MLSLVSAVGHSSASHGDWFVVTAPVFGSEHAVQRKLRIAGLVTYLPVTKGRAPLFSRLLFTRNDGHDGAIRDIVASAAYGALVAINMNGVPSFITPRVVDMIKAREEDGFVVLRDEPTARVLRLMKKIEGLDGMFVSMNPYVRTLMLLVETNNIRGK